MAVPDNVQRFDCGVDLGLLIGSELPDGRELLRRLCLVRLVIDLYSGLGGGQDMLGGWGPVQGVRPPRHRPHAAP